MKMYTTAIALALALLHGAAAHAEALFTERVNVDPTSAAQADGSSGSPAISADGCVVAFVSKSTTLAPAGFGLTAQSPAQVYAVDRCVTPHTLELVSVTNDGTAAADAACSTPNVSADGRFVAFITAAGNLPLPNSAPDNAGYFVFVRDRAAHTTASPLENWRVTAATTAGVSTGTSHRYMSADANRFVFEFSNSVTVPFNLYLFDRSGGPTTMQAVCPSAAEAGTTPCTEAQISADGSKVLFGTDYPIVAGDVNGVADAYAFDVASSTSALVSVNANGTQANQAVFPYGDVAISSDGRFVAFSSDEATNFPGATVRTLLLKDMSSGAVSLISAATDGTPASLTQGTVAPQLSADGNRLAFTSDAYQLQPWTIATFDTLVYDQTLRRLRSACMSASGSYGNLGCDSVAISADGKWAALRSTSRNLVPNDTNGWPDIFVVALDPVLDLVFADGFEP